MKWERAVHHVETAAEECQRIGALAPTFAPLRVSELWAFGEILGDPRELDEVSIALAVDLPSDAVAWATLPSGSEHWLSMTRLPKNPVRVWWRSVGTPIWNHRVVRPLRVWDLADGIDADALAALKEGRGATSGTPAPTHDELAVRLDDELRISLAELRARTSEYDDRRWGRGSVEPAADALWRATYGYLDVLSAVAPT